MTALTLNHHTAGHNAGSFFATVKNILDAVAHEIATRKAIREMNGCTQAQLKDFGLTRSEIETAVRRGR